MEQATLSERHVVPAPASGNSNYSSNRGKTAAQRQIKEESRSATFSLLSFFLAMRNNAIVSVIIFYYIHTEIYTVKSRRVNFRSQTDVNQSNVAYRFSHM